MPDDKIGQDSDKDENVDAFWSGVQDEASPLPGKVMTQEEYEAWEAESKEAKDGNAGEVQAH
jgi:hypothetical protein